MRNKSIAISLLFIFLSLSITYDVQGVVQEKIQEIEIYDEELKKINNELEIILDNNYIENKDSLDYDECFSQFKKLYNLLDDNYGIYEDASEEFNDEFLQENLKKLGSILNYLYTIDGLDSEIKDEITLLNEGINNIYGIKNALGKIISYYEDNNINNGEIYGVEEEQNLEFKEDSITEIEYSVESDNRSIVNIEDNCGVGEEKDINEEGFLDKSDLMRDTVEHKVLLEDDVISGISHGEDTNIYSRNIENTKGISENYKVNVSDLEVIKHNDKLKITFKIDNNLDLKKERNDLKIYIANSKKNNEVLITKDKSQEKYLYLENVTSISGDILKLGKGDTLKDGMYTVIFSDEEQEKLKDIGLENLVVKIESNFNDSFSSIVGCLKESDTLVNSKNIEEEDSENLHLAIDNVSKSEENQKSTKNTLPKTGTFLGNYLTLSLGIFMFLLGSFFVKYKKIGN